MRWMFSGDKISILHFRIKRARKIIHIDITNSCVKSEVCGWHINDSSPLLPPAATSRPSASAAYIGLQVT
ncbi:hypothetical protein CS542_03840 [Pedobacter sp. IW39]|nr:hypothetical protein CS542_03840 [Pedobacter sp. IW39]